MATQVVPHTEKTLIRAIHTLAGGSSVCRVAVAYCGKDAYIFFPEAAAERPEDLRILIDASDPVVRLGLTNPAGIQHLLGLTPQVKSLEGLHAKVFIFDERTALVGSTNLSEPSLRQDQMTLEISDTAVVRRLIAWFEHRWTRGNQLDPSRVQELKKLAPKHPPSPSTSKKTKIPAWTGKEPQPAPSSFDFEYDNTKMKELLKEFTEEEECPYREGEGVSCVEAAKDVERHHELLGKRLRSLMKRRSRWTHSDLKEIFEIAFTFGQAAQMHKPLFVRQNPAKVARSLSFLLEGNGDPYARFEKLLAPNGRYKLAGLGEAGITFLLYLWNPTHFAIVNKPVDDAFKVLKLRFGRPISDRAGEAYRDRTAAIKYLAKQTKLKTFARVDHFLDAIGKRFIR